MMMAIGLSLYNVALAHTVNHAFFKALLFLGAGAVIHSFQDEQDVRRMGGLIKFLPFTYSAMLAGSLSLMATPYLTAFYSKDLILELAYSSYSFSGTYAYILGTLTAGLTAFYSVRLLSLVFLTVPNGARVKYENAHDSSNIVLIPLGILALFSIGFGYIISDLLAGMGTDFLGNSVFIHPNNQPGHLVEAEFSIQLIIKLLPLIFTFIGAALALLFYNFEPFVNIIYQQSKWWEVNKFVNKKGQVISWPSLLYAFLNGKYYFDVVYNHFIVKNGLKLGYTISNNIDRGAIELVGPYGLSKLLTGTGSNISKLDTGSITTYALYFTIGLLSLLIITIITPLYLQGLDSNVGTSIINSNSSCFASVNSSNCIRFVFIYITSLIIVTYPSNSN